MIDLTCISNENEFFDSGSDRSKVSGFSGDGIAAKG